MRLSHPAETAEPTCQEGLAEALLAPERPAPKAVRTAHRFAVYRNNVVLSLIDALASTYPAVEALVGEEFFRAAAREFVLAHPPRSPILIEWGGDFPDWIAAFPPAAPVPYLGDVARLEWAWNRAYNAAEAAPIRIEHLAALPPELVAEATVRLHPSHAIVASRFPVVSLWAEATERAERSRLDLSEAETALIVRPDMGVDVRKIDAGTAAFLESLSVGGTIGEAAAAAGGDEGLLAERLAGLFQLGLAVGLSGGVSPTPIQP
ncbi:MAG: DNA-binding domain-containing protein [Pseudomonadota bacterium]